MTTAPASRRGSAWETWRLFASGWSWPLHVAVLVFAIMFVPIVRTPGAFFANVGILGTISFWFLTLAFEGFVVDRVAFLTLVPQPVAPRSLVLAPLCASALATAAFSLLGRLPAVASVAWLGCALWTIGATRWVKKLPTQALPIALALPAVASFAAWQTFRVAGWGASAAVSMALALVALSFQPRAVLTLEGSRPIADVGRRAAEQAGARPAVSMTGVGRGQWLASAVRYYLLNAPLTVATVILLGFLASIPLTSAAFGLGLAYCMLLTVLTGRASVYSAESAEFIRARPFSKGQLFVGGILVPLLPILLLPVLAIPLVNFQRFNAGGLLHNNQQTLTYVRSVLGATFLPAEWPPAGLTEDLWLRVRPLLHWDLVRCALVAVAFCFGGAPPRGFRAGDSKRTVIGSVIYWTAFAWGMRNSFFGYLRPRIDLPVLPVWLAALLATAAIAHWAWAARFITDRAGNEADCSLRGAA